MTLFKPVSSIAKIAVATTSGPGHCEQRTPSNRFGLKHCLAISVLLLGGFLFSQPAAASICGDHKNIKKILGDRYSESQRAFGMVNQDGLVEVYTSSKGSWSILMTSSNGRTCIIAAGKAWQEFEQAMLDPAA